MRAVTSLTARLCAFLILIGSAGGCATEPVERPDSPLGLIDMWRVTFADAPPTWLRIEGENFALWTDCGIVGGGWDAAASDILFVSTGPITGCAEVEEAPGYWITTIDSFERTDVGYRLIEGDVVVATLAQGITPPVTGVPIDLRSRPRISPADEERFAPAAPVRDDRELPVDLIGLWVPRVTAIPPVMLSFDRYGFYYFYGACASTEMGRFELTRSGTLLRVPLQRSTCPVEESGLPGLTAVETAAIVGGDLELFAREGRLLERFRRATNGQQL